jgi:hypothetical protein
VTEPRVPCTGPGCRDGLLWDRCQVCEGDQTLGGWHNCYADWDDWLDDLWDSGRDATPGWVAWLAMKWKQLPKTPPCCCWADETPCTNCDAKGETPVAVCPLCDDAGMMALSDAVLWALRREAA